MDAGASSESVGEAKKQLRLQSKGLGRAVAAGELERQSKLVTDLLLASPYITKARAVLLYAPLPDEVDVSRLIEKCLQLGISVALPRYKSGSDEYEAACISQPLNHLPKGRFNIPEPESQAPVMNWKLLDFVVVPGLGFDRGCRRLGRGKGFYDRLLTKACGIKCGVAFEHQVFEAVPVESHDAPLDLVAAPAGWIVSSRLSALR